MVKDPTIVFLAAGKGSRMGSVTDNKPKAMVPVADRPIIDWLIDSARTAGIDDIAIVTGFQRTRIENYLDSGIRMFNNPEYESTDMVHSLFCAEEILEGPVVISYTDILYEVDVLETLLSGTEHITVAVDELWQPYWELRQDEPVEDAESLSLDRSDRITSIGKEVNSVSEPDAQYIGLVKFSREGIKWFREIYHANREENDPSGIPSEDKNLHMTELLQLLIQQGSPVHGQRIQGGWVELDTPTDLEIARTVCNVSGKQLCIDRTICTGG